MKSLWTTFIKSLQLPKKQAVFALNRIGMDIIVIHLFIILFISSIPTYITQLQANERLSVFFFSIFFFIFHYLPVVFIFFFFFSIFASFFFLFLITTNCIFLFSFLFILFY